MGGVKCLRRSYGQADPGEPCQVQVAWTSPCATKREVFLQALPTAVTVSVSKEIVFSTSTYTFKPRGGRRKKKKVWQGHMYMCSCLPGGGLLEFAPVVAL